MTPETFIAHVEQSIARALRGESALNKEVLEIKGFATATMRHLFNNLCHLPKPNSVYTEVGIFCGATFCAAINNNPTLMALGFEDFSQDFGGEKIKEQLYANVKRFETGKRFAIIEQDFFKAIMPAGVDIFYYDGHHDLEFQRKALPHIFNSLAPVFLFIVDDFSWESVSKGTQGGFAELVGRLKIEKTWVLTGEQKSDDKTWWNGVFLAVCSKT
jgi:hypothetical protein